MGRSPSIGYIVAVSLTALIAVVGLWLPWLRKLPVGYIDGQPYYTEELLPGQHAGFQAVDPLVVLLVFLAVVAVVTARKGDWSPRGVIIAAGAVLLWWSGTRLLYYGGSESHAVEPGLHLSVLSAVVLLLLGAIKDIKRFLNPNQDASNENPPTG